MSKAKLMEGESIENGLFHFHESCVLAPKVDKDFNESILKEAAVSKKVVLKPRIEAIHAGRTRNNNIYPSEKLRGDRTYRDQASGKPMPSGVYSFTMPYPKPMITDHFPTADNTTGRITNAQYVRDALTGREMIIIIPEITSPDAIEKVLDGRYMTVSVGATTSSAVCNICGKDIINEGWCEHEKGVEYDGTICGWIVGELWFDECSWVAVPADVDAAVVDKGEVITMEAYVSVEDTIYDISDHNSILTESVASTLGLVAGKGKVEGGSDTMPVPEQITVTVEEFNTMKEQAEKVTTLEGQLAEKDTKISELTTELETKDATITEKDTLIAEKETALQEKETALSELTTAKADLDTKATDLTAQVEALTTEKQNLMDQMTETATKNFKDLVERVVDLKIVLKKPGVEEREAAILDHNTRGLESLVDTQKDLLSEIKEMKNLPFVSEKVKRPGIGVKPGEPQTEIDGQPEVKEVTMEDMLRTLFSGPREVKKQK